MGWLGWSERESMESDVNAILIGMEGRIEMMYPQTKKKPKAKFADRFKEFAKSHNAVIRARSKR